MSNETTHKEAKATPKHFEWIVEVLVFATVTPALVYAVIALKEIPAV